MGITIRAELISKGYKFGSAEYRKRYKQELANRATPEAKRAKWARQARARHERLKADPIKLAKQREYDRLRKRKQRELRGEQINERQRKNYAERGEERRKSINDGKKRRNPAIGLASLIRDVQNGRRDPRDLINRSFEAVDECSALIHRGARKQLP